MLELIIDTMGAEDRVRFDILSPAGIFYQNDPQQCENVLIIKDERKKKRVEELLKQHKVEFQWADY